MRRMLILALAVAVAAARYSSHYSDDSYPESGIQENIFRPGVEYTYHYDSQVLTGIRTASNQLSGVKIHCMVKMQVHRDGTTVLKMEQIRIWKLNDDVHQPDDSKMLTDDQLTQLTGEQAEQMIQQLSKPIKCRYEEGEVRDVKSVPSDKYWSINIKKGLLSLMQLKLGGRSTYGSDIDSMFESHKPRSRFQDIMSPTNGRRMSSRTDSTFKVIESDVNGDCETKYFINSDRSSDSSSVSDMKVTKVKDFNHCLTKNSFEQGTYAGLPHYPSERKLIQPSMTAEYQLTGDRHNFLIKKASLQAKYLFKPVGDEDGQISTHINQKLQLTSTEQIQNPFTTENFQTERNGLKMEIPKASWHTERSGSQSPDTEWKYKELVERKLSQLLQSIYPTMKETSAFELMQLNLIVRNVPRRELYTIVKSYLNHESTESKKKCEILLDILPTIQNPEVAKVLIDLIRDGSVRGIRARVSLGAMSLVVRPSPDVVKSLMSLYKQGTSLELQTPHIRQTILLSVGTLCNKMINTMRRVGKPIPELVSTVEEVSEELTKLLEESSSERDTIRILKSMGNMGSKELIQPIKSVIDNTRQPKTVREQAVFALRKLAKPFDKQVHPILISVVMNKKEAYSVRISAFVVLKKSLPTYTTLELIANSLRSEPSSQVKTFIYSSLVNLANTNSHISELKESCKNARKVLKLIRSMPIGIRDSKEFSFRYYSEKRELGAQWNGWETKSETSGMTKSIVGSLYTTIFGNRLHLAEGGIDGTGVDQFMRHLSDPNGLFRNAADMWKNREGSLKQLFTPRSFGSRSGDKLREFIGGRSFEPRSEPNFNGYAYGEILGHELFYHKVDTTIFDTILGEVLIQSPHLLNKLTEGFNIDELKTLTVVANSLVLPTPMGIPLSLNISTAGVFKVQGHIRIKSMPTLTDFLTRRPFMNKKFEVEGSLKPSCSMEVFGYMGVDLRWLRTGTALKGTFLGKLPIKGQISVDPHDSKLTVKYEPPQESVKLLKIKIEPTTFIYLIPKHVENLPFHVQLRPMKGVHTIQNAQYEKKHTSPLSGFSCHVKAQWTKCKSQWCPLNPFTGRNQISVEFEPQDKGTTREVVLKIRKFTQDWYNEGESSSDSEGGYSLTSRNYRTSSRDEGDDYEGFESVDQDEMITSPRKVEVIAELEYKGYRTDKKLKSKITWLSANNYVTHQVNLQVVGVATGDLPPYKVMANGMVRLPVSVQRLSHVFRTGETIGKLQIGWGLNGFKDQTVQCRVWETDSDTWNSELRSEGIEPSSVNDPSGTSKNFRYGVEVEFPPMNRVAQKYLTKVLDVAKLVMYRHVKVGIPEHMPLNKIVVYGQYTHQTTKSKMSLIVKTPRETDLLLDMPLSCPVTGFFDRPGLHDQNPTSFYKNSTKFDLDDMDTPDYDMYGRHRDFYSPDYFNEVCKVHRGKMQTFDGTPLLLPVYDSETTSSRCDILLAQDCSSRGTFSVTGSFKHGRWSVKTLVFNSLIELIPQSSEGQVTCRVNGQEMRVRESTPVEVSGDFEDSSSPCCTVEKTDEGLKLKLRQLGVTITLTENSKLYIKLERWSSIKNSLCGLCGNHNYDPSDDMTSLDRRQMYSSRQFVMDSVLPSSYCDARDYERQLGSRHEGFCRKQKTMKFERSQDGIEEICFSKQPVTACRKHCSSNTESERTVRFCCVPRDSETAERLLEKYHSGSSNLWEELSGLPTSTEQQIEQPDSCTPSDN